MLRDMEQNQYANPNTYKNDNHRYAVSRVLYNLIEINQDIKYKLKDVIITMIR